MCSNLVEGNVKVMISYQLPCNIARKNDVAEISVIDPTIPLLFSLQTFKKASA